MVSYKLCNLVYKVLHGMAPNYPQLSRCVMFLFLLMSIEITSGLTTYGPLSFSVAGSQLGIISQYISEMRTCHMNGFQSDLQYTCSAYPTDCKYLSAYEIRFVNALSFLNITVTSSDILGYH